MENMKRHKTRLLLMISEYTSNIEEISNQMAKNVCFTLSV